MLSNRLNLVPGLRLSGAIPLLTLYSFMAGTGMLLFLIYQATRRHNLVVHSSTRSRTPYLRVEIGGLSSDIIKCEFCAWVVAVVTSWDAGVSLSRSVSHYPPPLSLPQDLAP
jgi:hypothetical protein